MRVHTKKEAPGLSGASLWAYAVRERMMNHPMTYRLPNMLIFDFLTILRFLIACLAQFIGEISSFFLPSFIACLMRLAISGL